MGKTSGGQAVPYIGWNSYPTFSGTTKIRNIYNSISKERVIEKIFSKQLEVIIYIFQNK